MRKVIFYSWQSDLPNRTNRGFIQTALENAAKKITGDDSVSIEPVIDRDTLGVAGAPDISSTIFAKITAANIFVADVSLINQSKDGRRTPNPNVLIELGYALKCLGYEKVILVFNSAFGDIKDSPFDLRTRRITTYEMPLKTQERAEERKKLEIQFEAAIRSALEQVSDEIEPPENPAVEAIEKDQKNKTIILRKSLSEILKKIDLLQPKKYRDGGTVDDLITAVESTQEVVVDFSKITETIATMDDTKSAIEVYRWFGEVLERYDFPKDYSGKTSNADYDYFKFVGHELFVSLFAFLMREQKWNIIKLLLDEAIPVKYLKRENSPGNVYWKYASKHLVLLLDESRKKGRLSLHADILNTRHKTGGLSGILPIEEFAAADFFLFLFGELPPEDNPNGFIEWRAWSALYMKHAPMFLKNAERLSVAKQISKVFNIEDVEEFKKRLFERAHKITKLFSGGHWDIDIREEDIKRIGTR